MALTTSATAPSRFFSEVAYSTTLGFVANLSTTASGSSSSSTTATSVINFYQVEELTFLWILFVLIVAGNATVLVALLLSKGHKSRMNFFIKHLAAADLCVGLFSVTTEIIWKITVYWDAGAIACKVIRYLQCVVTFSSNYVLVALSLDRYDAITHPMNFSGSWRRARILVGVAWILSGLFSSPILIFFDTKETDNYGTQCWIDFPEPWHWQVYMTLISLSLFFIPAVLISACYIIIVCTIWKKGKAMQTNANVSSGGNGATNGGEDLESRRASSRGLIPKAKVKTVKMTFVIIFVFILCWSPYMVFDLLQVYQIIESNSNTSRAVATFIQSLAHLNSAANPLIYCLFSTNIGATLCNVICCRRKQPPLPTGLTTSTHSTSQSRPLVPNGQTSRPKAPPLTSSTSRNGLTSNGDRPSVTFRTAASIEA